MLLLEKNQSLENILESKEKVFVQFSATWCGPCKRYTKTVESLEEDFSSEYTFVKVEIDDHQSLASKYQIRSVPQTFIFESGVEPKRFTGAKSAEELKSILER